ncbi:MAG: 30S ribosomal protein S16 [Candidatus Portnoybacteria bacterium RBG_13_40_8]|uniref:Small ribosomal subunit protein bS16 n=1 Tax=Candidatus Portnoybacteria bacterium RBG_13_40_8 TaxID=1801990 RepID=A0A1G2F2J1_9BACT|nr:MAG: 30S ribosomal protein S16 [Candidatus Portnoybacteria bacterium RBG_13_40_8]
MLKIRLQRIGKKNSPSYRIALVEHTTSPQGKFIELLGTYNPRLKTKNFKKERIEYWLSQGAQPSSTVHNLLVDEKIIKREKLMAWKSKKQEKEEKPATPEASKKEEVKIEESKTEQPALESVKAEESKIEEVKPEESKPVEQTPVIDSSPLAKGEGVDTEPKKE